MDFFRVRKSKRSLNPGPEKGLDDKPLPHPEEPRTENGSNIDAASTKSANADPLAEVDDDDDDFIINEVKRRLKELRRNSFMVLIPEEESCEEDEGEDDEVEGDGEMHSSEWRDVEAEGRQWWGGFDVVYDKYCERMLFFDRMSSQQLKEAGSCTPLIPLPSPKPSSKKLLSPFSCISMKKMEEPGDDTEHLQLPPHDPYQYLETSYVAHICLSWEALHCQYAQLCQKISCQPVNSTCYNYSTEQFQQFQVLLQRFIENEPFEHGLRPEVYARARHMLPRLLQVPNIKGADKKEVEEPESESMVFAPDLLRLVETSILTFHLFLKMDKKKPNGVLNLLGDQNQIATHRQQIQSALEKKSSRLKELCKKRKGWKKKSRPRVYSDIELLFGLIDLKVISRTLRMTKITKEQLQWCEEKLKKIGVSDGRSRRDPSPALFPC